MKNLLMLLIGLSFGAAAEPNQVGPNQPIEQSFGQFMGEYKVVGCESISIVDGNVKKDFDCQSTDASIYLSQGFQAKAPYDSFSLNLTEPSGREAAAQLGFIEMNAGQVCHTEPGYQYCDEPVSRPSGPNGTGPTVVDHFLTEVRIQKVRSVVVVKFSLTIPNRDGKYLHRSSTLKLKKK